MESVGMSKICAGGVQSVLGGLSWGLGIGAGGGGAEGLGKDGVGGEKWGFRGIFEFWLPTRSPDARHSTPFGHVYSHVTDFPWK
jgi:hypothetical protein